MKENDHKLIEMDEVEMLLARASYGPKGGGWIIALQY